MLRIDVRPTATEDPLNKRRGASQSRSTRLTEQINPLLMPGVLSSFTAL
jgi:hypothetical protein